VIVDDVAYNHDVAWTGSELAVMYNRYDSPGYTLHLALVQGPGLVEDTDVVIELGWEDEAVSTTWTGSEFGVAWEQATIGIPGDHGLYVGRIARCD
jgi:hypothetical protein